MFEILQAVFLGIVEGLTEFLPVSSTGHLILAGEAIKFVGGKAKAFEVFIQLGAILAVLWLYRDKMFSSIFGIAGEKKYLSFWFNIFLAFLPAAIFGLLFHKGIKQYLFTPFVVSISLLAGGIIILWIEARNRDASVDDIFSVTSKQALLIGLCQVLALVPGVSRSGATIMGALVFGLSRRASAEFSFFLAVPTMFAATLFDLYKSRELLQSSDTFVFAAGFVAAFVSAVLVIKWFVAFISQHNFRFFAYYRIIFGALLFAYFMMRGN